METMFTQFANPTEEHIEFGSIKLQPGESIKRESKDVTQAENDAAEALKAADKLVYFAFPVFPAPEASE